MNFGKVKTEMIQGSPIF